MAAKKGEVFLTDVEHGTGKMLKDEASGVVDHEVVHIDQYTPVSKSPVKFSDEELDQFRAQGTVGPPPQSVAERIAEEQDDRVAELEEQVRVLREQLDTANAGGTPVKAPAGTTQKNT